MRLTEEQFKTMSLRAVAKFHGLKEVDFISEAFPTFVILMKSKDYYQAYINWYTRTQNKLAKALK
jgi:hypothetical protein